MRKTQNTGLEKCRNQRVKSDLNEEYGLISEEFFLPGDYNTESTVETSGARIHDSSKVFAGDESGGFDGILTEKTGLYDKLKLEREGKSCGQKKYYYSEDYFRKVKGRCKKRMRVDKGNKERKEWRKQYKHNILEYKRDVLDPPSDIHQKDSKKHPDELHNHKRKQATSHDVYSLQNIVYTSSMKRLKISQDQKQIQVPQFTVLNKQFYSRKGSCDFAASSPDSKNHSLAEEDDSDQKYEELHKECEKREELNKPPLVVE